MKKLLFALIATLISGSVIYAQAYEGILKVRKVEEPAIVMVYDYPGDIVESAFKARLADKRLKGNKSRGFLNYSNSVITEIAPAPLDYSFKFNQAGKRGKEKTTVYLLMRGGGNNLSSDPAMMARNAKSFLESAVPDVQRSHTISQIKRQEEVLVKEEKKLRELKNDQADLEKKLEKNKKDQNSQERVIQSQNDILSDLKARQN